MFIRPTFLIGSPFRHADGACLALHRGSVMFEAGIPLLNLSVTYGIIVKCPLNLLKPPRFWRNLMQYLCTMRLTVLRENQNLTSVL